MSPENLAFNPVEQAAINPDASQEAMPQNVTPISTHERFNQVAAPTPEANTAPNNAESAPSVETQEVIKDNLSRVEAYTQTFEILDKLGGPADTFQDSAIEAIEMLHKLKADSNFKNFEDNLASALLAKIPENHDINLSSAGEYLKSLSSIFEQADEQTAGILDAEMARILDAKAQEIRSGAGSFGTKLESPAPQSQSDSGESSKLPTAYEVAMRRTSPEGDTANTQETVEAPAGGAHNVASNLNNEGSTAMQGQPTGQEVAVSQQSQESQSQDSEEQSSAQAEILDRLTEVNQDNLKTIADVQKAWNDLPAVVRNQYTDLRELAALGGDVQRYAANLEEHMAKGDSKFGQEYAGDELQTVLDRRLRVGAELQKLLPIMEQALKSDPEVAKGYAEMDKFAEKYGTESKKFSERVSKLIQKNPALGEVFKQDPQVMRVLSRNQALRAQLGL